MTMASSNSMGRQSYPIDHKMMKEFARKHPIFRIDSPSLEEIAAFHEDGFVAYPNVLTNEGQQGFTDEILSRDRVVEFFETTEAERSKPDNPQDFVWRNWDDKGPWSDQLFDAPFVKALMRETVGQEVHFCHSTMHFALRGSGPIPFHQDHHHWRHENPVNLAERDKWYIQMLYYPIGFKREDKSLSAIAGSHRVAPTSDVTAERMLAGELDEQAGRELKQVDLELPPGSMVFLNARTFHAVSAKPLDSPQEYRIFVNYIFKEAGPPHRYTQPIQPEWLERADPERKRLFQREHWTEDCWSRWMA